MQQTTTRKRGNETTSWHLNGRLIVSDRLQEAYDPSLLIDLTDLVRVLNLLERRAVADGLPLMELEGWTQ